MEEIFGSPLTRLKISAYAVGVSLLLLVGVAIPLKLLLEQPSMLWFVSPFHLALTCWFLVNTFQVAEEFEWKFSETTLKLLVSCFIPFGTFFVARLMLNKSRLKPKRNSDQ
jgi:integral membrane protein